MNTATAFQVGSALVGGWAGATYEYASPLDSLTIISIQGSFTGPSLVSAIPTEAIMGFIQIHLKDQSGNVLSTFGQGNGVPIELLDSATNQILIEVVVPMADVRQLEINIGGYLGAIQRDFLLEEIWENKYSPEYVANNTAMGYSHGLLSLCVNCTAINPDHATNAYDPNNDFAFMRIPLAASIGANYTYMTYDWGGSSFSGGLSDLFLVMERVSLASTSTVLINENLFGIEVTYSDLSTELFEYGAPFVEVSPLSGGSGRFVLRIDLNDTKDIISVEVQLRAPIVAAENALRIYSVFVESPPVALPLEDLTFSGVSQEGNAVLSWEWQGSRIMQTELERMVEEERFVTIQTFSHDESQSGYMQFTDTSPQNGTAVYRLRVQDDIGQAYYSQPVILNFEGSREYSWTAYPNPVNNQLTIQLDVDHPDARLVVYDMLGRVVSEHGLMPGSNGILTDGWEKQLYILQIEAQDFTYKSKILKKE